MAIASKLRRTERIKHIDGTYDVTFEEVDRVRVFPEDEVREVIAEAVHKAQLDLLENPMKYERLFNIYSEIARIALDDIQKRFDISIKVKDK